MAVGECLQEWGSLVLRPHPAHVKWRELVSQVQIFGLAPEVRIEIMQKREQVCTTQSNAMKFIIQYWPTCILYTLTITRLLYFCKPKDLDLWHQTPSLWPGMMSLSKGFDSVGLAWTASLVKSDFLKEPTVVMCLPSEPGLYIPKPYPVFLLSFAPHCKWQKAGRGLHAQIAMATYAEVLKHSEVPREFVRWSFPCKN